MRKSDQFFGGVLVIGTIDPVQLKPIKGRPFLCRLSCSVALDSIC